MSKDVDSGIITQLERALQDELDYRIEARNSATFRRALAEFPHLLVPKVIEGYTTEKVLTTEGCGDPVWIDVVGPFVDAERILAWRQRMRACDPLNSSQLNQVALLAIGAGHPEQALEVGEFLHGHGLPQNLGGADVQAFLALGQVDEAKRRATATPAWLRDYKELQIAAWLGDRAAARAALERWLKTPRAATNISADILIPAHALAGDRVDADRIAASLDANPVGPMFLAAALGGCMCGAPFDIERTPSFKARLAEAGWRWPPPDRLHYKTLER